MPAHWPDSTRTMSSPASLRSWLNFVVPGDVPNLGEEDSGEGGAYAREAQEQPVRRERGRDGDEFGLNPRDARPHTDQAGREVGALCQRRFKIPQMCRSIFPT